MIILGLLLVCLFLAAYIWNSRRESPPSYIKETIDFFSSQDTPWLSSEQLELFEPCTSYDCYSSTIASLSVPSLIVNMLVGQPFKYIWRDRNANELFRYLRSLKRNNVDYQKSIRDHSYLYTDNFGEWPQGQDIIDTFTQTTQQSL
jgi:hypothetical protein